MKKKLKGAVLLMVVILMAVCMILTMAALTIAVALNQRTNTKFEDNQAYFSARSALNSTLSCIQNYTGIENDEYVLLAQQVRALGEGNTGDYFIATTTVETEDEKGIGVKTPVTLRFENIDSSENIVKITATAKYADSGDATVSVVFSIGEFIPNNTFSNALTTLGGASGVNVNAYGGSALNLMRQYPNEIELTNQGKMIGSVIINGPVTLRTQTTFFLGKGDSFVCMGDSKTSDEKVNLSIANTSYFSPINEGDGDDPYFFVSGNLNIISNCKFGYEDNTTLSYQPMDVHCNTLTGSNGLVINGNLYIHGSVADIEEMFNPTIDPQLKFNFNSLDISGSIYFDDDAAAAVFEQKINEMAANHSISSMSLEGNNVSAIYWYRSDAEKQYDAMKDYITDPYEVVEQFQNKDSSGNLEFDGSGKPVLVPVKSAPGGANSLADYDQGSAYVIDTGSDDVINIDLTSGLYAGWGGAYNVRKPIIVDGTGVCNFFLPAGKTFQLESSCLLTRELYNIYSNRSLGAFSVETDENSIKSPNINIYLGDGSKLEGYNNSVFAGYIYGPKATFVAHGVSCSGLTYKGESMNPVQPIAIIGAAIVNDMSSGAAPFTAVYIPQANGGDDEHRGADGSLLKYKYYSN